MLSLVVAVAHLPRFLRRGQLVLMHIYELT